MPISDSIVYINPNELSLHHVAKHWPEILGRDYDEFLEDIKANGINTPIVIHGKEIIDGRHRWLAAKSLGIDVPTRSWIGSDDESAMALHTISANKMRRHVSKDELAIIAQDLMAHYREKAKQRQMEGGEKGHENRKGKHNKKRDVVEFCCGSNEPQQNQKPHSARRASAERADEGREKGHENRKGKPNKKRDVADFRCGSNEPQRNQKPHSARRASAELAEATGLSEARMRRAGVVVEKGIPELVEKAKSSEISISLASKIARLEPERQAEIVSCTDIKDVRKKMKDMTAMEVANHHDRKWEKVLGDNKIDFAEIGLKIEKLIKKTEPMCIKLIYDIDDLGKYIRKIVENGGTLTGFSVLSSLTHAVILESKLKEIREMSNV